MSEYGYQPYMGTAPMIYMGPGYMNYVPRQMQVPEEVNKLVEVKERVIEREIVKEIIKEIEKPVIVYREIEKPIQQKESGDMGLTSFTGILVVIVICILTSKIILPRLSWKYAIKAFIGLIYRPWRRQAKEIRSEWAAADKE